MSCAVPACRRGSIELSRGRQARRLPVGPLGEETIVRLLDQHLRGGFALADLARGVDREQQRFVAAPIGAEQLFAKFDLPLAAALHDEVLGSGQGCPPVARVQTAELSPSPATQVCAGRGVYTASWKRFAAGPCRN